MQYKLAKGGEVIKTDIQVGDNTRPFFSVSLWQKPIGSMALAGDVVLLQSELQFRFLFHSCSFGAVSFKSCCLHQIPLPVVQFMLHTKSFFFFFFITFLFDIGSFKLNVIAILPKPQSEFNVLSTIQTRSVKRWAIALSSVKTPFLTVERHLRF